MSADVVKKLRIKPDMRVCIMNPPEGYLEQVRPALPEGVTLVEPADALAGEQDFVQLFVRSAAEVEAMAPDAVKAVKYDGLLWMCYPKKTSKIKTDIHRDTGWETLHKAGLAGIAQVAIDETWSATRFRPIAEIKRQ